MPEVKVFSYSERGIFNSIIFYLREHPEKTSGFISTLDINDTFFNDDEVSYTFLNEQSFSDFDYNDWIIIAKKGNEKRVIFIEGKVKTFNGKYDIEEEFDKIRKDKKYDGVSSNIFAQLYYKYLLKELGSQSQISSVVGKKEVKKIGENEIVKKAYNDYVLDASSSSFYYVAILPVELCNDEFIKKFNALEPNMESKNIKCAYWGSIECFFGKAGATEVIENFDYNRGQIY
ncbi:hypothetical protein Barb6_01206 [Bacteroidales bacterium Barb6]|nr:hypothetical protein Barb6_01206 [Bacteroidales bacterium Barb6]